jgi:hypothetical protein
MSSSEMGHFTLEAGSTVRYWHTVAHELDVQRQITNFSPLIVRRFGPDLDHPVGQFWFLQTPAEAKMAVKEVIGRLADHALPFLDRHASEKSILSALEAASGRSSPDFYLAARAIIEANGGDMPGAVELLKQARIQAAANSSQVHPESLEPFYRMIERVEKFIHK